MNSSKIYVRTDDHGVRRVGTTHVMLDSVVIAFQQGDSAEEIQRQYPSLSLEEVYGAIAHYLANRDETDAYLRQQDETWTRRKAELDERPNATIERLRAVRNASSEKSR